jgi:hypothetical protein
MYQFLASFPEWAYLALVTVGLSILGGADVDRFTAWLAPWAWRPSRGSRAARMRI